MRKYIFSTSYFYNFLSIVLSLEIILVFFLYAGVFKAAPYFSTLNSYLDLTILFGFPLLTLAVLGLLLKKRIKLPKEQAIYLCGFVVFCTWSLVSYLLAGPNDDSTKKLMQLALIGGSSIVIIKGYFNDYNKILRFLIISVVVGFIFGLYELFLVSSHSSVSPLGGDGGYQWLSRITFISFVIALVYLLHVDKLSTKIILIFVIFVTFFGMLHGGARQAIFAIFVSLLYIIYISLPYFVIKRFNLKKILVYSVSIISFVIIVATAFYTQIADLLDTRGANRVINFVNIIYTEGPKSVVELSNRSIVFRDALSLFKENPIFGVGFGSFREHASSQVWSHPHNVILELLSELGLIGFILFLFMIVPVILCLLNIKHIKHAPHLKALAVLIVGYMAMMMSSGDLGTNRLLFAFCTFFLIAYDQEKTRRKYFLIP